MPAPGNPQTGPGQAVMLGPDETVLASPTDLSQFRRRSPGGRLPITGSRGQLLPPRLLRIHRQTAVERGMRRARQPRFLQHPKGVLLARRLDDPCQHQLPATSHHPPWVRPKPSRSYGRHSASHRCPSVTRRSSAARRASQPPVRAPGRPSSHTAARPPR